MTVEVQYDLRGVTVLVSQVKGEQLFCFDWHPSGALVGPNISGSMHFDPCSTEHWLAASTAVEALEREHTVIPKLR